MKTITKICKQCRESFEGSLKEHRRGNAKFCGHRCSAIHSNLNRPYLTLACKSCEKPFKSKASHAKYCSASCSSRSNNTSSGRHKYRYHLNGIINKLIGTKVCLSCGWDKTTCDVHHIIPRKKGGTDAHTNITVVCPNCHRLLDRGIMDATSIPTVSDRYRTISSSQ